MKWCCNLLLGALAALAATDGLADGCFVWQAGVDLNEPSQKAIISLRDGTETLVLQVKYEGKANDFAWIVPLPAKPEVTAIEPAKGPFAEISRFTQAREHQILDGRKGTDDIEVLERKQVGVYDVAILSAADATALVDWLTKNGFAFPKNRTDVLKSYIRDRWVYAALRIDPQALTHDNEQKLRRGELQPVRFRFSSTQAVYPLRISSLNDGTTEVLLYLLADQPLVYAGGPAKAGFGLPPLLDSKLMGTIDPDYGTFPKVNGAGLPLTWAALNLSTNAGLHLCKYRAVYASAQMTGDLRFQPINPLAFGKLHLEQAGNNLQQQRLALRFLATHDRRYTRRLWKVEHQIQEAWDKQSREMTAHALVRNATSTESANRVEGAWHPELPRDLVRRLARDSVPAVRAAVAARQDIATLRDVLQTLARDPEKDVRVAVAFNEQAPVKWRAPILLQDAENSPKVSLGYQSANPALLAALAGDTNLDVRVAVAHNTNTAVRTLWRLAVDQAKDVKVAAARNPKAPVSLRLKVAKDPDRFVRCAVAFRLPPDIPGQPFAVLRELAKDTDADVRSYLLDYPNLPEDLIRALAADAAPEVRYRVASFPRVSPELLRQLAADAMVSVRYEVAKNPTCPLDILRKLANDQQEQIATLARRLLHEKVERHTKSDPNADTTE